MAGLQECLLKVGMPAEDKADIEKLVAENGGNATAGVKAWIRVKQSDLDRVHEQLAAKGLDSPAVDIDSAIEAKKPKAPRRKPTGEGGGDVLSVLAARGGIRDDEGHSLRRRRNLQRFVPGWGYLIRDTGMSIDAAGEVLWEEGFFGPSSEVPRPGENAVLEIIERGAKAKVYIPEIQAQKEQVAAEPEIAARNAQAEADVRDALSRLGMENVTDEDVSGIVGVMGAEGLEPEDAIVEWADRQNRNEIANLDNENPAADYPPADAFELTEGDAGAVAEGDERPEVDAAVEDEGENAREPDGEVARGDDVDRQDYDPPTPKAQLANEPGLDDAKRIAVDAINGDITERAALKQLGDLRRAGKIFPVTVRIQLNRLPQGEIGQGDIEREIAADDDRAPFSLPRGGDNALEANRATAKRIANDYGMTLGAGDEGAYFLKSADEKSWVKIRPHGRGFAVSFNVKDPHIGSVGRTEQSETEQSARRYLDEFMGRLNIEKPKTEKIQTVDGARDQFVLPGAEQSAQQAAKARGEKIKPKAPQKDADVGLFAKPDKQGSLFSLPRGDSRLAAFKRWFGDSKVVDENGEPLRVYHGTAGVFDKFQSHKPTSVYTLDGQEIERADSWDMGDDRTGKPDAFHYGALSDAQTLGPDAALEMRERELAPYLAKSADARRHVADLRRLAGKRLSVKVEDRPTKDGFYFTPAPQYSYIKNIGVREGGNVVPVYLSIKNPIYLNASQIEAAGYDFNVEKYKAQGYDGAIFAENKNDLTEWGFNGAPQIVAFDPEQIKSVFNPDFNASDPKFSAARDYEGEHRPPGPEEGAPLNDLTGGGKVYPDDVYGPNGVQYYGHFGGNDPMDATTMAIIRSFRGRPAAKVRVYRAVPAAVTNAEKIALLESQMREHLRRGKVPEGEEPTQFYNRSHKEVERLRALPPEPEAAKVEINPGDWVTVNRKYAKDHGESTLLGKYRIISKLVRADEVFTDGNSIHEFGYWPTESAPTNTQAFKKWFKKSAVVHSDGKPMRVFRGDFRADKLGASFKIIEENEGGSGGIYFTDNAEIASGYAKGKTYIEGSYDEVTDNTIVTLNGKQRPLAKANYFLTPAQRQKLEAAILTVGERDGPMNGIGSPDPSIGRQTWNEYLKRSLGNYIRAADEVLLKSGALSSDEMVAFWKDVGIFDRVVYDDPTESRPAITPVYLSIQNPFEVVNATDAQIDALARAAGENDASIVFMRYNRERGSGEPGTVVTVTPAFRKALLAEGYDGIKDVGGRVTGAEAHTVWIALNGTQVKSIFNKGTWSRTDDNISLSLPRLVINKTAIDNILARLRKLDPSGRLSIRFVEKIRDLDTGRVIDAEGRYFRRLIELALNPRTDSAWTLDHEVIHGLVDLGVIKPSEWAAIRKAALASPVTINGVQRDRLEEIRERYAQHNLTEEQLIEEAVADYFADWRVGRVEAKGFVRQAFARMMELFDQIKSWLNGQGFHTADSVFGNISRGKTAMRQGVDANSDPRMSAPAAPQPNFYSALTAGVENFKQPKASPAQWKGIIANLPGVKAEEIEWSGVNEWLDAQLKSVTRDEVVAFLKANEVQVRDVTRGSQEITDEQRDEQAYASFLIEYAKLPSEEKATVDEILRARAADRGGAKFGTYVLPGGENYRELLLTLPPKESEIRLQVAEARRAQTDAVREYKRLIEEKGPGDPETKAAQQRWLDASKETDRLIEAEKALPKPFTGGHYDEPNVLAHIRFNKRVDANGKRTLFIEEVQSDWHQSGRKRGYAAEEKAAWPTALPEGFTVEQEPERAILTFKNWLIDQPWYQSWQSRGGDMDRAKALYDEWAAREQQNIRRWFVKDASGDIFARDVSRESVVNQAINRLGEAARQARGRSGSPVPDAPFKTTWPELAFKRALRWAAENGFDQVAWTTGAQQAERYDLSKHISKIEYDRVEGSSGVAYNVGIYGMDGRALTDAEPDGLWTIEEVEQHLGKEIADKMQKGEGGPITGQDARLENAQSWKELSGLDLKVGGEGMIGFYDRILPAFANKYAKKWGARVGAAEFNFSDDKVYDRAFTVTGADGEFYVNRWANGEVGEEVAGPFDDEIDAEREVERRQNDKEMRLGSTAHALPITPEMRQSVLRGQPLFSLQRGTVAQERAGNKAIAARDKRTIGEKIRDTFREITDGLKDEMTWAIADESHGLRRLGKQLDPTAGEEEYGSYVAATLSRHGAGQMEAFLRYGAPVWDDQRAVMGQDDTGGLFEIVRPIFESGKERLFDYYAYARRVKTQNLIAQGREHNLTQAEVDELIDLGNANPEFVQVFDKLQAFKKKVLDAVEGMGLINAEQRAVWEKADHVPFYRVNDKDTGVNAPRTKRGLGNQSAGIRRLTGGDETFAVIDDATGEVVERFETRAEATAAAKPGQSVEKAGIPIVGVVENIARNITTLIDAAMKNHAAQLAVDEALAAGWAEKVPMAMGQALVPQQVMKRTLEQNGMSVVGSPQGFAVIDDTTGKIISRHKTQRDANAAVKTGQSVEEVGVMAAVMAITSPVKPGNDIVAIRRDGNVEYYKINDKLTYRALAGLYRAGLSPVLKPIVGLKTLLTRTITSMPGFMARNFARDSAGSWLISGERGLNFYAEMAKSIKALAHSSDTPEVRALMAAGGDTGWYQNAPPDMVAQLRDLERQGTIGLVQWANPRKLWDMYMRLGRASELANRRVTYESEMKRSQDPRRAAFKAADLLDFQRHGGSDIVQFFTAITPFLNARIQGLYKLGRAGLSASPADRRSFAVKAGMMVGFSLAIAALNMGDDDDGGYNDMPEWIKDGSWLIPIHKLVGKEAAQQFNLPRFFMIPKPFELGILFGTVPERMVQALAGNDRWQESAEAVKRAIMDTLAINPIGNPALGVPFELWADRSFFTGNPIVGRSMEGLGPEAYHAGTSEAAKFAGRLTGISPLQIEHVIRGFTGTAGVYTLAAIDAAARAMNLVPSRPEMRFDEMEVVRSFIAADPARGTKWTERFYDLTNQADAILRQRNNRKREGDSSGARAIQQDNRDILSQKKRLDSAADKLSDIRTQMKRVRADLKMTPAEKRERLESLTSLQQRIAKTTAIAVEKRLH